MVLYAFIDGIDYRGGRQSEHFLDPLEAISNGSFLTSPQVANARSRHPAFSHMWFIALAKILSEFKSVAS